MECGPLRDFTFILAIFHISEFTFAYVYTPAELSVASCLLSWQYLLAMAGGLAEYMIEEAWWPGFKSQGWRLPGWALVCAGEVLRKSAMVTAKGGFTHRIQKGDHPTGRLVTWGPYRLMRHPGYVGWIIWAIGTQVLLHNPVCTVVFGFVVWSFFRVRIAVEEAHLQRQFPEIYHEYCTKVPTGIPFMK